MIQSIIHSLQINHIQSDMNSTDCTATTVKIIKAVSKKPKNKEQTKVDGILIQIDTCYKLINTCRNKIWTPER